MTSISQSKIIPPKLNQGDKIGIVSTARKISLKEITPALDLLKKWGLNVILGKNLFKEFNQFCGTDKERASDFQNMLNDSSIKAILCARGGYGTVKIIDKINFKILNKNPKWIAGYSDITVLHSHLNRLGFASIHGTMPVNFLNNTPGALTSLRNALFFEEERWRFQNDPMNIAGVSEGELVGGNLSILYSLLGSKSDIKTNGKILFLEDLDEYIYHIDRMMMSLKRNGKLKNLAGLMVGGMSKMHDNETPFGKTANEIILEAISDYNYPVCFNVPAGHINDNRALILGKNVRLTIGESTKLEYL